MDSDRLKSIEDKVSQVEQKIDKVGDALVIMARLEERIVTLFRGLDSHIEDLKTLTIRVTAIEYGTTRVGVWAGIGDKLLWIAAGAVVTWVLSGGLKP